MFVFSDSLGHRSISGKVFVCLARSSVQSRIDEPLSVRKKQSEHISSSHDVQRVALMNIETHGVYIKQIRTQQELLK